MADDNKDLADLSAALGHVLVLTQRLGKSTDQQVKWLTASSLRTTMEMSANKARVDCLLEMRKPPAPAPTEPATKK
jgi:hypothetical protein